MIVMSEEIDEICRLIDVHLTECPHDNCILNLIQDKIKNLRLKDD